MSPGSEHAASLGGRTTGRASHALLRPNPWQHTGLRRKGAHIADSELQRLMANVDLDGNNTLDFDEFLTATVFLGKLERRELMMRAFEHFDSDNSGYITEDELRAVGALARGGELLSKQLGPTQLLHRAPAEAEAGPGLPACHACRGFASTRCPSRRFWLCCPRWTGTATTASTMTRCGQGRGRVEEPQGSTGLRLVELVHKPATYCWFIVS